MGGAQRRPGRLAALVAGPGCPRLLLHGQGQHRLPFRDLAGHTARLQRRRRPRRRRRAAGRAAAAGRGRLQRVPDHERVEVLHQPQTGSSTSATSCATSGRTRCATSSPSPGRRPPTPTSPGRSSSAAPTSSWPTSGATWSTGRSRWRTRTTVRSRRRVRCSTIDHELLAAARGAFATVGELLGRNRFKLAITEAMRVVGAANKYISDTEPWKLGDDPDRRDTVLHTALQVVSDANTLLTPVPAALRAEGVRGARRRPGSGRRSRRSARSARRAAPDYPVIMGDYAAEQAVWASPADQAGYAAGQADAAVRQARRVAGRDRPGMVSDPGLTTRLAHPPGPVVSYTYAPHGIGQDPAHRHRNGRQGTRPTRRGGPVRSRGDRDRLGPC